MQGGCHPPAPAGDHRGVFGRILSSPAFPASGPAMPATWAGRHTGRPLRLYHKHLSPQQPGDHRNVAGRRGRRPLHTHEPPGFTVGAAPRGGPAGDAAAFQACSTHRKKPKPRGTNPCRGVPKLTIPFSPPRPAPETGGGWTGPHSAPGGTPSQAGCPAGRPRYCRPRPPGSPRRPTPPRYKARG